MTIWWFGAFVILLLMEIGTVNLVSVWFAIGAIVAMICSVFIESVVIQLLVFIVVSLIALAVTKPLIKKFKVMEFVPTNLDRVIGKVGTVTKEITKDNYGEVKVFGNAWTAASDKKISVGTKVKVLAIEGVKLIVKVEEE